MGGHAFPDLHCPRIPEATYLKIKSQCTTALKRLFQHVTVPTEMPEKRGYGDVDFLVSSPLCCAATGLREKDKDEDEEGTLDSFPWHTIVDAIKTAFNTPHGRRGGLNPDCMFFAVPAAASEYAGVCGGGAGEYWIQVDVKVSVKPRLFEWCAFELVYASQSKMIGSMVKPLGLTVDPVGFHVRVEGMDEVDFRGSMVWIGADARDVLRVVGLDRWVVDKEFATRNELYEYIASSWLFNPAHFAARLAETKYCERLEDRSPHWTYFIKEWVPQQYPDYTLSKEKLGACRFHLELTNRKVELQSWYRQVRAVVREKVFTMFPDVAVRYYAKRAAYVKELEEADLKRRIMGALSEKEDGRKDDLPQPRVIVKNVDPVPPPLWPSATGELTPPLTPDLSKDSCDGGYFDHKGHASALEVSLQRHIQDVPLYLATLPRMPPHAYAPQPPPVNMSIEAKLNCLSRWTGYDPDTGALHLLSEPQGKDVEMSWADATYAGATKDSLIKWAEGMWWTIWIRQSRVNYVGMWRKRFEKEDTKARSKEEAHVKEKKEARKKMETKEKIRGRLMMLNAGLALPGTGIAVCAMVDGK